MTWVTADGEMYELDELDDRHLDNIIDLLEDWSINGVPDWFGRNWPLHQDIPSVDHKLTEMRAEKARREHAELNKPMAERDWR